MSPGGTCQGGDSFRHSDCGLFWSLVSEAHPLSRGKVGLGLFVGPGENFSWYMRCSVKKKL